MSKRPRTEPPNSQEDIWGDDFTYDEVTSINNIETLASQSHIPGKLLIEKVLLELTTMFGLKYISLYLIIVFRIL